MVCRPARMALLLALTAAVPAVAYWASDRLWASSPFPAMARAAAEAGRLARASEACQARLSFKMELASALVQQRLTVSEAVGHLRDYLEGECLSPEEDESRTLPGSCREERWGRNLILLARSELHGPPGQANEVLARLEGELREYLKAKGQLVRAPVPAAFSAE